MPQSSCMIYCKIQQIEVITQEIVGVRPKVIMHQSMLHLGSPSPASEFVKKKFVFDKQRIIFELLFFAMVIDLRL